MVVLVAGIVAVGRLADALALLVMRRFTPAAGAVVRLVSTSLGYLVLVFAVFGVFGVSLTHLLIGFGLAGVVVGIAAQQSLGNIFASLVLLFARPFIVGDHIRIRSGSIGVIDATVLGIGLTYVTVRTDDGLLKVPNSRDARLGDRSADAVIQAPVAGGGRTRRRRRLATLHTPQRLEPRGARVARLNLETAP